MTKVALVKSFRLTALALLAGAISAATPPSQTALKAWDSSVQAATASLIADASDPAHFLLVDRQAKKLQRVSSGEIDSIPSSRGGMLSVPSALIHHWIGTVFLPNVGKTELLGIIQDYDSYAQIYRPAVIGSKLLSHRQNDFTYRLKLIESGFGMKSGLLGDFHARYYQLNASTGYSITEATHLVELNDPGTDHESPVPPDSQLGYVQRAATIVRYRQAQNGIYLQVETLTLSRDIPAAIKWFAAPLVQRFSRNVMIETLERLRTKVNQIHALEAEVTR